MPKVSKKQTPRNVSSNSDKSNSVQPSTSTGVTEKTFVDRKAEIKTCFSEIRDPQSAHYQTWLVAKAGRRQVANFIMDYVYFIKGSAAAYKSSASTGGWVVEILTSCVPGPISMFIPSTDFGFVRDLERSIHKNTEYAGRLTLSCDQPTLKRFHNWKQEQFAEKYKAEDRTRSHVLQLGIQPDQRTLVMGENSMGIYEEDPAQPEVLIFRKVTKAESKFFWNASLNLADFSPDLAADGSAMTRLIEEIFNERFHLNFYALLGYAVSGFFAGFIRENLGCALPVPILVGPTISFKTRLMEWICSVFGHHNNSEVLGAWLHMKFIDATQAGIEGVGRKHPFAIMIQDCANMEDLENLTKQYFDGARRVTKNGTWEIANPLAYGCNFGALKRLFDAIEPSSRERMVVLEQLPQPRKPTMQEKKQLAAARLAFSGNLTLFANPSPQSFDETNCGGRVLET
ncbi:uncharacterized protein LOC129592923 [Paramacrobiotus metropolitanus]|uniref:uncharacterized protein LOC129592923 n=1 Tax=Paramacrobiotus metropolitanus TaxID=2943436 RepID=UPI0024457C28|nr:uncharacterized protein LOC129592923 [Paramacrobiotus metropolitanus]